MAGVTARIKSSEAKIQELEVQDSSETAPIIVISLIF